ncbi:MAG: squalene/phytoene synthase family protein [Candidatus Dormibacteria bacterium]
MTPARPPVAVAPDRSSPTRLPDYSLGRQGEARAKENFPIAAWLLRPGRREARAAIYGFCRLVDDLGDENLGDAETLLGLAQSELEACYGGSPEHPVFRRLQPVIQRFGLDRDPFQRLIRANLQDQVVSRYATWAELDHYCTLSATPVGQLVLALEGIRDEERLGYSDSICTGLQLANMWQDVASDRDRGRRYLPLEVLEAHQCGEDEWWGDLVTEGMLAAEAHAVARARRLLLDGWPLVGRVPGLMRLEMATFILCGLAAASCALESGPQVFREKARLSPERRRRAMWQAALAWSRVRPPRET